MRHTLRCPPLILLRNSEGTMATHRANPTFARRFGSPQSSMTILTLVGLVALAILALPTEADPVTEYPGFVLDQLEPTVEHYTETVGTETQYLTDSLETTVIGPAGEFAAY